VDRSQLQIYQLARDVTKFGSREAWQFVDPSSPTFGYGVFWKVCMQGVFSELRQDEERGSITHNRQEKGRGFSFPALGVAFERKGSCYELALILRSICSMRVSRFLLRFSYSRTFLSSSAERPSSLLEISSTVNPS
jgi:hypothetical protein